MTILVGRERSTGMNMATAVHEKGSKGKSVVEKIKDMIDEVGDKGQLVIMRSDQEPAMKVLMKDAV